MMQRALGGTQLFDKTAHEKRYKTQTLELALNIDRRAVDLIFLQLNNTIEDDLSRLCTNSYLG